MKIIPAIDIKDGRCVRLFKGDFEQTTEYSADPAAVGRRFSKLDVQDIHIVDLDGAKSGTQSNHEIVSSIASESDLDIQLGGGIRTREDVAQWLSVGVRRCVVGSVAISSPSLVLEWMQEFGADSIVLALDVKLGSDGIPLLTTHGWTQDSGLPLWDCLTAYDNVPPQHVLCTDVARDGAMAGPNTELYSRIIERYPALQLQASGGVRNIEDMQQLREIGVPAAITGRALLDGKITENEVASFRQSA
ncbi:MAG: 1-(5-phosphoribosyl)-5-[(5-phosphoribosylamino)methylideneamino]imidazole-4-carboxamide isomerase [Gammaproteobacteria bacterium]|nr:1-(5-phosphoribosyl)-5-[(5-phosphoribosylamino)methylideneamino]imidazole-4-carboxamide isomerase [Gammaproteobacteria bacterium]